jgi:hypothetical protein
VRIQRSKAGALAVGGASVAPLILAALVWACTKSPTVVTRTVTAYVPTTCDVTGSAYALYTATGDFDPSAAIQQTLASSARGSVLGGFPTDARVLLASVSANDAVWRGISDIPATGDVDLLLWPLGAPCALTGSIGVRTGSTLGAIDRGHALLAGGAGGGGNPAPTTFVIDLTKGTTTAVEDGLLTARSGATSTRFVGGGVLAGGTRVSDGTALDNAEVFVSGLHGVGDFDHVQIPLSGPRMNHGAITLVDGTTLLVGGTSTANGPPTASLEIVDPSNHSARTQGLTQLAVARANPKVLLLASGEVLVAGGTDANGAVVATLEWLAPDASKASKGAATLVGSINEDFVALSGGGALAVIAPPADQANFVSTWVIAADGALQSGPPLGALTSNVRLFPAPSGGALLWTGDVGRWLVWSSWSGTFSALSSATQGPPDATTLASPDVGLAMWLDAPQLSVVGLRSGVASEYATFTSPLLATDTSSMAPDQLGLTFDATNGLSLETDQTAFIADATYDGVSLDFDAPTNASPDIVFRDDLGTDHVVGEAPCDFASTGTIHVERDGADILVAGKTCVGFLPADSRVTVGFRASLSAATSVVRNVRVVRR